MDTKRTASPGNPTLSTVRGEGEWTRALRSALIELREHLAESSETRSSHSGSLGLAERFQKEALEFERLAPFEVNERGRFVSAHGEGARNLCFLQIVVKLEAKRASGGDDIADQFANKSFPIRISQ